MADQIVNLTIEYSDTYKVSLQDAIMVVLYGCFVLCFGGVMADKKWWKNQMFKDGDLDRVVDILGQPKTGMHCEVLENIKKYISSIENSERVYVEEKGGIIDLSFLLLPLYQLGSDEFADQIYPKLKEIIKDSYVLLEQDSTRQFIFTGHTKFKIRFRKILRSAGSCL